MRLGEVGRSQRIGHIAKKNARVREAPYARERHHTGDCSPERPRRARVERCASSSADTTAYGNLRRAILSVICAEIAANEVATTATNGRRDNGRAHNSVEQWHGGVRDRPCEHADGVQARGADAAEERREDEDLEQDG